MTRQRHGRPPVGTLRMRVRYEGRVQGVGFRYTTVRLAAGFAVTGYVMNAWDGSVALVAEGRAAQLEAFLQAVRTSALARYITGETSRAEPAEGQEKDFRVRTNPA